jgi:chromosome segregation ATPase
MVTVTQATESALKKSVARLARKRNRLKAELRSAEYALRLQQDSLRVIEENYSRMDSKFTEFLKTNAERVAELRAWEDEREEMARERDRMDREREELGRDIELAKRPAEHYLAEMKNVIRRELRHLADTLDSHIPQSRPYLPKID